MSGEFHETTDDPLQTEKPGSDREEEGIEPALERSVGCPGLVLAP